MSLSLEFEKIQHKHSEDDDHDNDNNYEEEEKEEEESLSLCDLPVNTRNEGNGKEEDNPTREGPEFDFDFDFGSLSGSTIQSMCAADEVFSGGQMLPFRNSVSSETGLSKIFRAPIRSVSKSESMDRVRFGSRSSSSRSSSTRSYNSTTSSSSCSSSSSSNLIKAVGIPTKPKSLNQFGSNASPKPYIRASGGRVSTSSVPSGAKSTMWQVLRLGLVRAPEIELQDLKARNQTNNHHKSMNKGLVRNNSVNSSTSTNKGNCTNENPIIGCKISDLLLEMEKRKHKKVSYDHKSGGIFKNCKCSVGVVEPISSVKVKGKCSPKLGIGGPNKSLANQVTLNEDKSLVQKKQEEKQQQQNSSNSNRHKQQHGHGKQAVSHHRTFEWLRDLSHASVLNS